jgi:hypothetical protein
MLREQVLSLATGFGGFINRPQCGLHTEPNLSAFKTEGRSLDSKVNRLGVKV